MSFLLSAYRGVTACSMPILQAYLDLRLKKGKEHPTRLHERFGHPSLKRPTGHVLWLHAASNGELTSALPLLRQILTLQPDWMALVTTGTVTSAATFEKEMTSLPAGRVMHQFIPVDHPTCVKRFLDHWRPNAAIWMESELWPNMLLSLKERHIPAILTNARMRPKTAQTWKRFAGPAKAMMDCFESVLVMDPAFETLFKELGARNVRYLGNLKLDKPAPPYNADILAQLQIAIGDRPCIGAIPTHPTDEIFFAENFIRLKKDYPDLLGIIVPKHPKRRDEIIAELQKTGLSLAVRSLDEDITPHTDLYIADTMGEMGLWYNLCDFGVTGGSFFAFGGQNPFEGTHYGYIPIYGPHMFNFLEMTSILEQHDVGIPVAERDGLYPVLLDLLQNPDTLKTRQDRARALATSFTGITPTIADYINTHIMAS
jgi:3-deoxy-D-manno-octulosonic-acid transferase